MTAANITMMVYCTVCHTVVWAFDHTTADVRGIANLLKLPCPKCGSIGSFDGYSSEAARAQALRDVGSPDVWHGFRAIAQREGLLYEPDGQCRWFGEETQDIAMGIRLNIAAQTVAQRNPE